MESGKATNVTEPSAARVLEVARAIYAHTDLADHDLVARLQAVAGLSERDAELAVVFVPVAFGRVILRELGVAAFPTTYFIKDSRGTWVERRLPDEPWYRAAMRIAAATVTHGYSAEGCVGETPSRAEFEEVMYRSPEVACVSDALQAGLDLKGATLSPLHLIRLTVESERPRWQFWRR
jgi:hypothetical protein